MGCCGERLALWGAVGGVSRLRGAAWGVSTNCGALYEVSSADGGVSRPRGTAWGGVYRPWVG